MWRDIGCRRLYGGKEGQEKKVKFSSMKSLPLFIKNSRFRHFGTGGIFSNRFNSRCADVSSAEVPKKYTFAFRLRSMILLKYEVKITDEI
jgi:hypothetical protein